MMAKCRFCGGSWEEMAPAFECPLCGRWNDPAFAPVALEWLGGGFATAEARLPFGSTVTVAPDQQGLLLLDGRRLVLNEGRHEVYPIGDAPTLAVLISTGWNRLEGVLTRTLLWPEAAWELRLSYGMQVRVTHPEALGDSFGREEGFEDRIVRVLRRAGEAALEEALSVLSPLPREGRDALALRVDAALANVDDEGVNRWLDATDGEAIRVRDFRAVRALLAAEDPDGDPCPACGRRHSRADGANLACAFCGTKLYWCPKCRRHTTRLEDRWCVRCGGRLYG